MIRVEVNVITGERTEIVQKIYSDGASVIVIDASDQPPEGFEEVLDPLPTGPTLDERKNSARIARDNKLSAYYDPGAAMCLRGLRMTSDPQQTLYLKGKLAELDLYAVALQNVPQQPGFPDSIDWPAEPNP